MSETYTAEVEPGDPHNDQMAARATEELDWHLGSTRNALPQGGRVEVMTLIASAFINYPDAYPRERLASILAAALMRLAGDPS